MSSGNVYSEKVVKALSIILRGKFVGVHRMEPFTIKDSVIYTVDSNIFDWVVSFGVLETIPGEEIAVQEIHQHNSQGIIISWGHTGVNGRTRKYARFRFTNLGYKYHDQLSKVMRKQTGIENILVMIKE